MAGGSGRECDDDKDLKITKQIVGNRRLVSELSLSPLQRVYNYVVTGWCASILLLHNRPDMSVILKAAISPIKILKIAFQLKF